MNIIFEGIDGTGKSTLCRAIQSEHPDFELVTFGGAPKDSIDFWGKVRRAERVAKENYNVIFDRHPVISEYAYGDTITDTGVRVNSFDAVRQLNAQSIDLIVYCKTPLEDLQIEANDEADDEYTQIVKRRLVGLELRYESIMWTLRRFFRVLTINALACDVNVLARRISDRESSLYQ